MRERDGRRITFAHALPYWLEETEGLGELDCDVESEKATGQDGELYQGATANVRNVTIKATRNSTGRKRRTREIRQEFFAFFVPRETGTLYLYDGTTERKIEYKVESCEFEMDGIFRAGGAVASFATILPSRPCRTKATLWQKSPERSSGRWNWRRSLRWA